jgi:hypothetical protein
MVVCLLENGGNNACAKNTQNEPCDNPITARCGAPLYNLPLGLLPVNAVCAAGIAWILLNRKAHFFSPSVNYTKLDGNANEPCTAVHNGLQGHCGW